MILKKVERVKRGMTLKENFTRIITAVDGSKISKKAFEKAIHIGKYLGIPVVAIYVIDMSVFSGELSADQVSTMWKNILKNEGEHILNTIKKEGLEKKVKLETKIVEGTAYEEIIKEARKDDLIIMGSKGKSAIDRVFIGSVSENVLHHSKASVMIVR